MDPHESGRAMTVVLRAFAAYAASDRGALLDLIHPDADLQPLSPGFDETEGPYHGRAGAAQWLDQLDSSPDTFNGDPDDVRIVGDVVVVIGRVDARPDPVRSARRVGWLIEVEDGLIKRFCGYTSPDAALRAAGF